MSGYPIVDRALRQLIRDALGAIPLPRQVARKAQERGAVSRDIARLSGTIWGAFSAHNHYSLGWREPLRYQAQAYFPNDEPSMDRYGDLSGFRQARLVATVTKAARAGAKMTITGDGVTFAGGFRCRLTL